MEFAKRNNFVFKAVYCVVILALVATALIWILEPKKQLQLYPYEGAAMHLFSDSIDGVGTSTATWLDRSHSVYQCEIGYGVPFPYCGLVIKYKRSDSPSFTYLDYFEFSDATSIDLSRYSTLVIDLAYSGPSNSLNFYMRNAKSLPKNFQEYERSQYMHSEFYVDKQKIVIEFSELKVAKWWVDRFDPSQEVRLPQFGNIMEIGIDMPAMPVAGEHNFKINGIVAIQPFIPKKQLLWIAVALACVVVLIGIVQILLTLMAGRYRKENYELRTTMLIDPLTNCLNRLGLESAIHSLFPIKNKEDCYVMVLDLDHFKKINDTLGHTAGDEVLRQACSALSKELRSDDIFGRWGGEEFVIITKIDSLHMESLVNRLIGSLLFIDIHGAPQGFKVTMSVGVTRVQRGEAFEEAFKRADEAMYDVKMSGRANWKLK